MEHAASMLSPLRSARNPAVDIFFMTGARHWFETAFCMYSLAIHARLNFRPVVLDDGTLRNEQLERLLVIFPTLRLVTKAEADERVRQCLPRERFPRIHQWRDIQPLTRKLFDLHAGSAEWRLFLDSDMLFFRTPVELENHLANADVPLVQTDCWESYGYSRALTERLTGARLPDAINIGIFSINGAAINWLEVEYWLEALEREEQRKYNMTQCLCAMLMSRGRINRLGREEYKVWPTTREVQQPTAILHHYVAESKPSYYRWGWRHVLRRAAEPAQVS